MKFEIQKLDFHGFNLEDAKYKVSQAIPLAYKQNIAVLKIIHGKGEGILRENIRLLLDTNIFSKYVSRYTSIDEGYTEVYIKSKPMESKKVVLRDKSEILSKKNITLNQSEFSVDIIKEKKLKRKEKYLKMIKRKTKCKKY